MSDFADSYALQVATISGSGPADVIEVANVNVRDALSPVSVYGSITLDAPNVDQTALVLSITTNASDTNYGARTIPIDGAVAVGGTYAVGAEIGGGIAGSFDFRLTAEAADASAPVTVLGAELHVRYNYDPPPVTIG